MVALSVGAMLGMLALAVDLAVLFTARSEAQRAADAAALAGASGYREFDPIASPVLADQRARDLAYQYALLNDIRGTQIDSSEVALQTMLNQFMIRVTIRRPAVELGFARIFGISSLPVSARAAAIAAWGNTTGACVKPFGIPDLWHEGDANEDVNGNQVMDFGTQSNAGGSGGFAHGNGGSGPGEVWDFDPSDGDWYDAQITGLGTDYRNGNVDAFGYAYDFDEGRRFPLKFQQSGQGGDPSNWQSLDLTWSGESTSSSRQSYQDAIRGCIRPEELLIGGTVPTLTGLAPNQTRDPIDDVIAEDPDPYWDDDEGRIVYPPGSSSPYAPANTGDSESWRQSPRVITAVLINPEDVRSGNIDVRVEDLVQFFLEDPAREYPGVNPPHHAPITGRLLRYASGGLRGDEGGPTQTLNLVPRLVE